MVFPDHTHYYRLDTFVHARCYIGNSDTSLLLFLMIHLSIRMGVKLSKLHKPNKKIMSILTLIGRIAQYI